MTNIWDSDYEFNPNNSLYVQGAKSVGIAWKEFRTMYDSLHEVVKEEFDRYLMQAKAMEVNEETRDYIKLLERVENAPTREHIEIKYAA